MRGCLVETTLMWLLFFELAIYCAPQVQCRGICGDSGGLAHRPCISPQKQGPLYFPSLPLTLLKSRSHLAWPASFEVRRPSLEVTMWIPCIYCWRPRAISLKLSLLYTMGKCSELPRASYDGESLCYAVVATNLAVCHSSVGLWGFRYAVCDSHAWGIRVSV